MAAALVGTVLLALPVATESGRAAPLDTALFTAVSAVSVTGLAVVDTGGHWSTTGELVILGLVQLGGFGVTTLAALLTLAVFRRLGLRSRLTAQIEHAQPELGGIGPLLGRIARFYLVAESAGFVALTLAAWTTAGAPLGDAAWFGLFHSVSAFNNAGFSTAPDNLAGYAGDPAVLLVTGALVVVGGIGFPVVAEVFRRGSSWRTWSLHTRLTVTATAVLLAVGALVIGAAEWSNPATFGPLATSERLTNAVFASITPRTAGFNTFDYGAAEPTTLLMTQALMLIGGGSGSSAGGIKVGTFALLAVVIWSELRGDRDVAVFGRRIDERTQRQAVTIALLGVGTAAVASLLLAKLTDHSALDVTFETISAISTVGLSTGITPDTSAIERVVLSALMLVGRLGPVTVASALVLRGRQTLYRYPEGRPLLG